ncbi:MAG TPA: CHASE2 domain-containing protein [Dissulfurispiraceae bacterium]|nr:CHASE2 domain-containing protein [Dissulfurispiraceae bacterium]
MMRTRTSTVFAILLMAIAIASCLAAWLTWEPAERLEAKLYDLRTSLLPGSATAPITIVSIDQESANRLGSWPWPRTYFAQAITTLNKHGAKQIGLTILYAEKDPNPGLSEIRDIIRKIETDPKLLRPTQITALFSHLNENEKRKIQNAVMSQSISALKTVVLPLLKEAEQRIDADTAFKAALTAVPNVVLPLAFVMNEPASGKKTEQLSDYLLRNSINAPANVLFEASSLISAPLAAFAESSAGLGHINVGRDIDGSVRSDQPFILYENRLYPSLAFRMALIERNIPVQKATFNGSQIIAGDITARLFDGSRLQLVPRAVPSQNIVSFADLIQDRIPEAIIKDRIVLIGHRHNMPFEMLPAQPTGLLPSVDIVAYAIDNLLAQISVSRPIWALPAELMVILFIAATLFGFWNSRPRLAAILSGGIFAIWSAAAFALFLTHSIWVKIAYPLLFLAASLLLLLIRTAADPKRSDEPVDSEIIETTSLRAIAGGKTDVGTVRERNEDSYCIDRQIGLLAVADGVGGRASGEIASRMAIDLLTEYLKKGSDDEAGEVGTDMMETSRQLSAAFSALNVKIHETAEKNPQLQKMATTLTAILLDGARASIAHVGDSRAYLIRHDAIEQLTDDHTVAAEQLADGKVDETGRSRHILTKAIGVIPDIRADIDELELADKDILLVCSDGLTNMIPDSEILAVLKSTKDPFRASSRLVQLANKNGGRDNITVIVAYIQKRR